MKKILSIIILILVCSCSTSTDENGNSNTTVVPLPPTGLTGSVISPTQINLTWTDNSTNESGFKIERRIGSANYAVVGTVNQDVLNFSDSGLTPSTTYTYRVYAFNAVGNSLTYTNEVTLTTTAILALPTLTTTAASSITQTTAVSGGTISNDGGAVITARGVCWSTSPNPTISLTTKTTDGPGTGTFSSNITSLTASTIYYIRAYATNSFGTAYGNEISFNTIQNFYAFGPNIIDIDGNTYQTVINCSGTWTKTNLNVTKYSDGTPIPQVQDPTQWANLTTGAWCYFENNTANGTIYGKIYNWYAVMGIYDAPSSANPALRKKLAPTGWHIPSDSEWTNLTNCLGGELVAGGNMKSTGTIQAGTGLWYEPNSAATNASGFTGLPGSFRNPNGLFVDSLTGLNNIGYLGYWWSSSESSFSSAAWIRYLRQSDGNSIRFALTKNAGCSVRFIKD
jgi:uncharacterized protein (TIGR02145 family)